MSNKSKINRRIIVAYGKCVKHKKSLDIKVSELCECADLSRATFYLHFSDMENFLRCCNLYFAKKIFQQGLHWLENGKNEYETIFKHRNLLLSDDDRETLCILLKYNMFFVPEDHNVIVDILCSFAEKKGPPLNDVQKRKMNVFGRAYGINVTELLGDYSSTKAKSAFDYNVKIWNILFPDNKI